MQRRRKWRLRWLVKSRTGRTRSACPSRLRRLHELARVGTAKLTLDSCNNATAQPQEGYSRKMVRYYNGQSNIRFAKSCQKWQSLSDKRAYSLVRQGGEEHEHCVDLCGLSRISDSAAQILRKHRGTLLLNGLTSISDSVARSLGGREGDLYLDGITSLSVAAAKGLSGLEGSLFLNGVAALPDEVADAIFEHRGKLYLEGLATLTQTAIDSLYMRDPFVHLDFEGSLRDFPVSLTSLSNQTAWVLLKCGSNNHDVRFDLSRLTSISDTAAQILGGCGGTILLDGLTSISDEVAFGLGGYSCQGGLEPDHHSDLELNIHLAGLRSLSDTAASFLSKCNGDLILTGLPALSDRAATFLAKLEGILYLAPSIALSDTAARAIG
jgi:hypothetical protein